MKILTSIAFFSLFVFFGHAQNQKFQPLDSSPADIVYYPLNVSKAKDESSPLIKVIYSRPSKKGREIFGMLEQYGKIWRMGANESTEIRFYKSARINERKIKAGTYSLFAIPDKENWTIIINKQLDKWGAFTYNEAKDVMRFKVPVKKMAKPLEAFTITFNPASAGAIMVIAWDTSIVEFPISIK